MAGDAVERLDGFLREYTDEIRSLAYAVMDVVESRISGATRMVYDNWNATVVGYSPDGKSSHSPCSVASYRRWVNLFMLGGSELSAHDPHGLLRGAGSTVRSVRITTPADLDARVVDLLDTAIDLWPHPFDPDLPTTTVIAAVSEKRRPRR